MVSKKTEEIKGNLFKWFKSSVMRGTITGVAHKVDWKDKLPKKPCYLTYSWFGPKESNKEVVALELLFPKGKEKEMLELLEAVYQHYQYTGLYGDYVYLKKGEKNGQ